MNNFIVAASKIHVSELKTNKKYMSVSMEMFSTKRNLNGVAVTEAFIDDIVANKNDYVCMTLAADVTKLKKKDYRGLTHMYDPATQTFLAEEIGSFYDFEKVKAEDGEVALIGYARINKRSKQVCAAVQELYEKDALAFSFEIAAGNTRVEDGVTIIDADESNELTAMAIVSVPAYPESKAIDLVAEAAVSPESFFASANVLISEVDFETVRSWLWDMLHDFFGDHVYNMRPLLVGVDFALIYDARCGNTLKLEYVVEEDHLVLKDVFDVAFVRKEQSAEALTEEAEKAEAEATEEAEVSAEVVADNTESVETEVEKAEETEVKVEVESVDEDPKNEPSVEENVEDPEADDPEPEKEVDSAVDELIAKCKALEAEVENLKEIKAELDTLKAEKEQAELAEKRERVSQFVKQNGLNPNEEVIAEAIKNLDYEVLFAKAMENSVNHTEENKPVYRASFDIHPTGNGFAYLLEKKK